MDISEGKYMNFFFATKFYWRNFKYNYEAKVQYFWVLSFIYLIIERTKASSQKQ